MQDLSTHVESLRRPSLLIRAARAGLADYNRNRDLRRLMQDRLPTPEVAVRHLLDAEARAEQRRQAGDAGYSLTRHVTLMIALLGESRLLERARSGAR
ncbi:DUF6477 family protein [Frigidibacter sp. ROC022]|uniref:DUF6477 family protein n=1 Tax=Frigidibacter sp. ROC022 TaxID=2971796 RepID=UPI00215AD398|nr:DUF6477 family protein [Frigidibacter sp. ROC022]MCR8723582.1 DUF6477 family protein [Frigidibacter sp. ROC022]